MQVLIVLCGKSKRTGEEYIGIYLFYSREMLCVERAQRSKEKDEPMEDQVVGEGKAHQADDP